MFQSKVYLKSLLKIEDDWAMSNRYRSIQDITSQHEFAHENDLLYLSNN